ncbi:MAG: tetratricopeptide repeat protein [Myxococcota bacterium]
MGLRQQVIGGWILGLVLVWAQPAWAQPSLDAAEEAYRAGRFSEAQEMYSAVLAEGIDDPRQLQEVYLQLGVLAALFNERADAQKQFALALAIGQDVDTPTELAAEWRRLFERLRDDAEPFVVQANVGEVSTTGPTRVALSVSSPDTIRLGGVRVRAGGNGSEPWRTTVHGPFPTDLFLPASVWGDQQEIGLTIEVLDEHGGTLVRVVRDVDAQESHSSEEEELFVPTSTPSSPGEADEGSSVFASPWFWIITGVIVAAGATTAVLFATRSETFELVPVVQE